MKTITLKSDWFPTWVKVIFDPFCAMNFNKGVVTPYFEEFQVGITFVPKIKKRVSIHQLFSFPFHLII